MMDYGQDYVQKSTYALHLTAVYLSTRRGSPVGVNPTFPLSYQTCKKEEEILANGSRVLKYKEKASVDLAVCLVGWGLLDQSMTMSLSVRISILGHGVVLDTGGTANADILNVAIVRLHDCAKCLKICAQFGQITLSRMNQQ